MNELVKHMLRPQMVPSACGLLPSLLSCLLLCSATLPPQPNAPQNDQLAFLEGTVVNGLTKEPVRKAQVTLELAEGDRNTGLISTTDDVGRFRFANVAAGRYRLTARKSGFLDGYYGVKSPEDDGSLLRISEGDHPPDLKLLLFPAGIISGQVLDADGDPVPDYVVGLLRKPSKQASNQNAQFSGFEATLADKNGQYRIDGIAPGTYYLRAGVSDSRMANYTPVDSEGKPTRVQNLATFYPSALSLADAQSVTVEIGQEQSGIDIHVQRGRLFAVKGKISGVTDPISRYALSALPENLGGEQIERAKIQPNGDFVFTALPPGKYQIELFGPGTSGQVLIGKAEVALASEDIAGLIISPFKSAQVRVQLVIEGEEDKPLTNGTVTLGSASISNKGIMQYQPQNNIYLFERVPPGTYWIWFNGAPNCYLKSVKSGQQAVDPGSIEINEGAVLDLLMTFSRNGASLWGDVDVSQEQSGRPVHVVLISEEQGQPPIGKYRHPELDQSFHFSVSNLPPGKYLAFAVEDDDWNDGDAWDNPDFVKALQSEGAEVELQEKQHSNVQLKLISKDETDSLRRHLGLSISN